MYDSLRSTLTWGGLLLGLGRVFSLPCCPSIKGRKQHSSQKQYPGKD